MTDKMREEFSAWYLAEVTESYGNGCRAQAQKNLDWVREDGSFADPMLRLACLAWQASRESLVIELPKPYAVVGDYAACGGDRAVWDVEYAEKITDRMCEKTAVYDRAGLEAAGLKVKP